MQHRDWPLFNVEIWKLGGVCQSYRIKIANRIDQFLKLLWQSNLRSLRIE